MSNRPPTPSPPRERTMLLGMAACCAGPMVLIVGLTSVFGLTLGPATALALGLTATIACVALMVHRHHHPKPTTGEST